MTLIVDSLQKITQSAIDWLASHNLKPAAWGRYLGEIGADELRLLAANNIALIAIARRSGRVCLGVNEGKIDGIRDYTLFIRLTDDCNDTGCRLLPHLFLDVEQTPDLTAEYWCGWAGQVAAVAMPCAYMPNRNNWPNSWRALESANAFQSCCGVWVAMYPHGETPEALETPTEWEHRPLGPSEADGIPYLAWQGIGNSQQGPILVDYSATNPAIDWVGGGPGGGFANL